MLVSLGAVYRAYGNHVVRTISGYQISSYPHVFLCGHHIAPYLAFLGLGIILCIITCNSGITLGHYHITLGRGQTTCHIIFYFLCIKGCRLVIICCINSA